MMKSPLYEHGEKLRKEAMRLSKESSGRDDAPDHDNPKVVELLDQAKEANRSHGSAPPLEGAYASGGGGAKYVSILPHIQKLQNDLEGMAAKGGKMNQEKSMEKAIAADDDFMSSGPGKDMSQSGVEDTLGLKKEKKISTKPLNIDTDFDDLIEFDEAQ